MKNLTEFIIEHLSVPDNIHEHLSVPDNIKAFTIIKPGFLQYTDEIHDFIVNKGFIMHDHTSPMRLSNDQSTNLYSPHKNKDFYDDLCKYMTSDDVVAAMWTFDNEKYPDTNTISLMKEIKDHFREKYGKDEMKNCMHSSDSLDNVKREAKILFN